MSEVNPGRNRYGHYAPDLKAGVLHEHVYNNQVLRVDDLTDKTSKAMQLRPESLDLPQAYNELLKCGASLRRILDGKLNHSVAKEEIAQAEPAAPSYNSRTF